MGLGWGRVVAFQLGMSGESPLTVGSWGREHKVASEELSIDPAGSGTHGWFLRWGMPSTSSAWGQ